MVKDNSGNVYILPLNFNLGFALCKFLDYTDIAPFDGALIYVLKKQFSAIEEIPAIDYIDKFELLFGPVCLNKYPNVKGKGAWKCIGKTKHVVGKKPVFKGTVERVALYKARDWTTVNRWFKMDINGKEEFTDYENVRELEMRVLYDMNRIEKRATMHFLLLSNKKVENYYDLNIEENRNLYLQIANTSFDKKNVAKYLKAIK